MAGVVPFRLFGGILSSLSLAYMNQERLNWFKLLRHWMPCALVLAFASAGRSNPARIAMTAMTTRSSMRVNAASGLPRQVLVPGGVLIKFLNALTAFSRAERGPGAVHCRCSSGERPDHSARRAFHAGFLPRDRRKTPGCIVRCADSV